MPLNPAANYNHWVKHGNRLLDGKWEPSPVINYDGFGLMVFSGTLRVTDNEQPNSLHTDNIPTFGEEVIKGTGLYVSKMSKRYNSDKTISVDYEAIGIEARCKERTNICLEPMNITGSEPIETHPDFKTKLAGTPSKRLNGATFDKEGKFTGFAVTETISPTGAIQSNANSLESLAGVKSYLSPKQTLRGHFHCTSKWLSNVPDWLSRMNGLTTASGQIMSMELIPSWFNPATFGNWLLTNINPENVVVDMEGKPVIIKVTYEMMRAKTVWNPNIYVKGD